jgi:hypothetical protein
MAVASALFIKGAAGDCGIGWMGLVGGPAVMVCFCWIALDTAAGAAGLAVKK